MSDYSITSGEWQTNAICLVGVRNRRSRAIKVAKMLSSRGQDRSSYVKIEQSPSY